MATGARSNRGESVCISHSKTSLGKALISKYLWIERRKTFPVLAEYLEVALAFTALGTLIRRVNDRGGLQGPVLDRKARRAALNLLLKKTMERLRDIATKAQELEDKLKEKNGVDAEQAELRRQLSEAEGGVTEMKKKRDEDSKANAKVMAIFSTQEQHWKKEHQRLKGEIVKLRKELTDCMGRLDVGSGKKTFCVECKRKSLRIIELEGQVKEKDFLMAAAAEDGNIEHSELAQKLGDAQKVLESLKEKVARESEAQEAANGRILELELQLSEATDSLRRAEREASDSAEARKDVEAQNETLIKEQTQIKQALKDQEKITSTVLERIECLKSENSELTEKLQMKSNHDALHGKMKQLSRSRSSHAADQGELHSMYMDQVAELENQVSYYQERLLQLEESALLRLERYTGGNNTRFESETAAEVLCVDENKDLQLVAAKSLLAQYIDAERSRELELNKWRKLYAASKIALSMVESGSSCPEPPPTKDTSIREVIEAAKAQQAAELAERHWYEIDTFERHMRAKDERMEALRMHLISLEKQVRARDVEVTELREFLSAESASKAEVEARLGETQRELTSCLEKMEELKVASSSACTKKRLRNMDESGMRDALESRDAELHSKDLKLAFVEAKLVQAQMQYEKERKSRETLITEVVKEKQMLEELVKDSGGGGGGAQASSIKNAIATACLEVEKLSEKIAEAREQIMHEQNGRQLEGFMQQATEVSSSGKALKKIQGLLFNKREEENTNKSALVTTTGENTSKAETTLPERAVVARSQTKTRDRATYAPILMKDQLHRYQSLFQRMNELSGEAEGAMRNGSTLTPYLRRALEVEKQVNSSGRKLSLMGTEDLESFHAPQQLLRQHLAEIQKRLELKIVNMVNELRARVDVNTQRSSRPVRFRRTSGGNNNNNNNNTARVLLENQTQQPVLYR